MQSDLPARQRTLHEDSLVVDGLVVGAWTRETFEALRRGGVDAANCTCCIWEDFATTIREVAEWQVRFREHADIIRPVHEVADLGRAKREGRVGVVLGWQNSSGFDDHLPYVELFHRLGLRVVQLTYNTANAVGSGCYESRDGGLTDFGHDLVAELNRVGILIDLSHVAATTAAETIRCSTRPVAYTHCAPAALCDHPRNKSDEELRLIAEHDGFVGVTMFPAFLRGRDESTVEDYLDAVAHVVNVVGEARVGVGTDSTEGQDARFFDFITRDKGHGRRLTSFGSEPMPAGMRRIEEWPNLTAAMERRGWAEERIRGLVGGNWETLLGEVWAPTEIDSEAIPMEAPGNA